MRLCRPALTLILACLLASAARANLLVNPSFELGTPTAAFTTLPVGSTAITGWTVTRTDVDIVGTFWVSHNGHRSIDLDGLHPGCLAQTFATTPGTQYTVTFWLAGNPACGTLTKSMTMSAAGQTSSYTFSVTGHSTTSMGWVQKTFAFMANAASTTLEMCSTDATGSCGPAVDDLVMDFVTPTLRSTWGRVKTIYR